MEESKLSERDRRERNTYLREFGPAMVLYAIVLIAVLVLVDETSDRAWIWWLLPILPLIGAAIAVYRSLRRADEYTRLLQYQAMALGFGAAIFTSLTLGFLSIAGVTLEWSHWLVFGAAMGTWGTSVGLLASR